VIVFVSGHDNASEVTGRTVTAAGIFLTAVAVTLWRRPPVPSTGATAGVT
jgi:hypothetical protein